MKFIFLAGCCLEMGHFQAGGRLEMAAAWKMGGKDPWNIFQAAEAHPK